jgi:hypothetical protein
MDIVIETLAPRTYRVYSDIAPERIEELEGVQRVTRLWGVAEVLTDPRYDTASVLADIRALAEPVQSAE